MITPHDSRHPSGQTQKGHYIMEGNSIERYTATSLGLEAQNTTFVVRRTFGDQDLLDLYSDYVVKRVREAFGRRGEHPIADKAEDQE